MTKKVLVYRIRMNTIIAVVHRGGKVSDDEDYHNVVAAAKPISSLLQARLLAIVRVLPAYLSGQWGWFSLFNH